MSVTGTLKVWFVRTVPGTNMVMIAAAPGLTCRVSRPLMALLAVSVAVIVWEPAVLSVALKLPLPLVSWASAGIDPGAGSLVAKWMVPA